jgi:hypothetical protein
MDNFVVAHGVNEQGHYAPLNTSSVAPDISVLSRHYSHTQVFAPDQAEVVALLQNVTATDWVFIHGLRVQFYTDSDGFYPLGEDQAVIIPGLADGVFYDETQLVIGEGDSGTRGIDFADGYIGDVLSLLDNPQVFYAESAVPAANMRLAGGYLALNQLIRGYDVSDPSRRIAFVHPVSPPALTVAYIQFRVEYSVIRR